MLTNEDIAVDLSKYGEQMDLGELFRQDGPVHLEIGSGKGTFLVNEARAHLDENYLGIEWASKFYRHCVDRMRRWGVENVRVLRTEAGDFIRRYVRDEALDVLHVYYPDPWPKKRHHKRRFIQVDSALEVHRCLKEGGLLKLATDHAGYFEWMEDILLRDEKVAPLFERVDFEPAAGAGEGEFVGTNFERKYIVEGRELFQLALRKR